jgi:hypothetical protein
MKRIANLIAMFMIGFFGTAMIMNDPQDLLIIKAKVMFFGFVTSTILHAIDEFKS